MANIRDLMPPEDALDLESRFDEILRARNEYEDGIGEGFREAMEKSVFDWDIDLPTGFFE